MRVTCLCLALVLSSGCSLLSSQSARFDKTFTEPYEKQINEKYLETDWRADFDALPTDNRRSHEQFRTRNEIIQELMWLCDQDFERYIEMAYDSRTVFDLSTDLLIFGASAAAAAASGGASTALAATAAGAAGFKGIINTNLYGDATRDAVIAQMRAMREKARADMFERMSDPVDEWSLTMSLMDVSWYSRQGNARQAVQSISVTAETAQLNQALRSRKAQLRLGK